MYEIQSSSLTAVYLWRRGRVDVALTPSVAKGEQEDSNRQAMWGNQKTLEEACSSASSLPPNSSSQPTSPTTSVYQVDTDGVL